MLDIPLKDYFRETRLFNSRLSLAVVFVALLTLALVARLVYLQIINHRHYVTLSQENRIHPRPIPPVRGRIFDRHGAVLAENRPVFTLEVIPEQVQDMDGLLRQISDVVELHPRDIRQFKKQLRKRPRFESLTLRTHLSSEEAARLAVNRPHLDGVELHARLQRYYPSGGLGVHAIGYVGRIDEQEYAGIDRSVYRGTHHIGKLGIEQQYERLLLGRVGIEQVEANAHGRVLRQMDRIAPVAGQNIYLNIDARVQAAAETALNQRRGAVVAMDPNNGEVLALVSTPVYDPNPFVNGIDPESYALLIDDPYKPLINRAMNGQYAPGSTIKPFFALAALELDDFRPEESIQCGGSFRLPNSSRRFRDWKKFGHGQVNLHSALVQSCDVYFYKLALVLGIQHMKDFLARFGFGTPTGIDIMGESPGLLPSREWKEARGEPWYPGETVVTGIGQGPILATPLQLASAVSMLASAGRQVTPRLLRAVQDPKSGALQHTAAELQRKTVLKRTDAWSLVQAGMVDVVHGEKGTARRVGWNAPYKIAGKTGTAQVKALAQGEEYDEEQTPEHLRDHALFIAFAPADDPQIAVAVVVENGGAGSSAAAPIARQIMDTYLPALNKQHKPLPAGNLVRAGE